MPPHGDPMRQGRVRARTFTYVISEHPLSGPIEQVLQE